MIAHGLPQVLIHRGPCYGSPPEDALRRRTEIRYIVSFLQDICQEILWINGDTCTDSLQHVGKGLDGGAGLAEVPHLLVHAQLDVGDTGVVQSLLQVGVLHLLGVAELLHE